MFIETAEHLFPFIFVVEERQQQLFTTNNPKFNTKAAEARW